MKINELTKLIQNLKSVAILCHTRPDGDTIGSALALYYSLTSLGIKAKVFCEDKPIEKFDFLMEDVRISQEIDESFEAVIFCDTSTYERSGKISESVSKIKETFNIDHHVSNERFAKYNYIEDKSSTCELMYEILVNLEVEITKQIATCLMVGLCTDTGGFSHKNVEASTFLTASKLTESGATINEIVYKMFKATKKERQKLLGISLSNMRFMYDDKLAIIFTREEDLKKCNADENMCEGFVDFAVNIEGVEVGISLLQVGTNGFKVSFRSKGIIDVNKVAGVFGGGGHVLASGCRLFGELEDVIDKLSYIVSTYL